MIRALLFAGLVAAVPVAAQDHDVIELAIVGGELAAEVDTVVVTQGDMVELRFTTDEPITLHLHGYDLEAHATLEAAGVMQFTADIAGRFPIEEHAEGGAHAHGALIYLEVHPR